MDASRGASKFQVLSPFIKSGLLTPSLYINVKVQRCFLVPIPGVALSPATPRQQRQHRNKMLWWETALRSQRAEAVVTSLRWESGSCWFPLGACSIVVVCLLWLPNGTRWSFGDPSFWLRGGFVGIRRDRPGDRECHSWGVPEWWIKRVMMQEHNNTVC